MAQTLYKNQNGEVVNSSGALVTDPVLLAQAGGQSTDFNTVKTNFNNLPTYNNGKTSPTISDYLGDYTGGNDYSTIENYYKNQFNAPINENDIYNQKMKQFQAEIDAVNNIYAQKLADQKEVTRGNLGTSTAMSARGGALGSPFGEAQFKNVQKESLAAEDLVRQEQNAKIQAILGLARQSVAEEIAAKRAAKEAGTKDYINFLKEKTTRNTERAGQIAKSLLAQGYSLDSLTDADIKELTKSGISKVDLVNAFKDLSIEQQPEYKTLSEGQTLIDPATGKVIYTAPKTYKPSTGGVGGLTPYQQFSATQSIAKDTQARTENAREMARQAQLIDQSYQNIVAGGDRSLNTQAIITSFNKILDPTSVVRESEYDRTAAGQSLLAQLEGKVQNIASGGAGVTEKTLKEASDIAKRYLEGARQSINAQNERARQIANQFGLNPDFVVSTYQDTGIKTIDDYRAEFPNATDEELQALMAEENQ